MILKRTDRVALVLLYASMVGGCSASVDDGLGSQSAGLNSTLVNAPPVPPSCVETVGKLPLELAWLAAPTPNAQGLLEDGIAQIAVHNPTPNHLWVDLVVRLTEPRLQEQKLASLRLRTRSTEEVGFDLLRATGRLDDLALSGRLDVLASVRQYGTRGTVKVAAAPAYYHRDARSGRTLLYGGEVLRSRYRSGDLSGAVARQVDLTTAVEIERVTPNLGGVR